MIPNTLSLNLIFHVFVFADIVMKDKIFVYDLARQRIGWANYDCKLRTYKAVCTNLYNPMEQL